MNHSTIGARRVTRLALPVLAALSLAHPAVSQAVDSAGSRTEVAWAISVTNRGISTIFTLDKPAASLDVSIRHGAFSANPQFRAGLDGTPWSFLVWGRYRLVDSGRLRVSVGAHPALAFRTATVPVNGVAREVVVARRSAAGDLSPSYAFSRNVIVGTYYMYSRGLDADMTRHTHFVAARAGLANVRLPAGFVARLDPEVYYLNLDDRGGAYLDSRLTLAQRDLPVSISGLINRPIHTDIPRGGVFLWNVGLNYAPQPTR
jgi:hypothetical protein